MDLNKPQLEGFIWAAPHKPPAYEFDKSASLFRYLPGAQFRSYDPLEEETGLFLTFAALEPTPESCLVFAHRYGLLGGPAEVDVPVTAEDPLSPSGKPRLGERFEVWRDEVRWMKHLVTLWKAARDRDRETLARFFRWEVDTIVSTFPKIDILGPTDWRSQGVARNANVQRFRDKPLFSRGVLVGPALLFLREALDRELTRGVHRRMLWSAPNCAPLMMDCPSSLLAVMYLQLAKAVETNGTFTQCPQCRRFFKLAPGVNRANRKTCSPTCRAYLYHSRIDTARKLHEQGKSAKAIAKELNAKIDIVRNWISSKEK
jgi:hypothetical protein